MLKSILDPLPQVLDSNALLREDRDSSRTAVIWLGEDGRGEEIITYAALDRMARSIATTLQARLGFTDAGEAPRVVLLCRPGPGFIAAFLGCLYARAIAVPAYPVDHVRHLPRLRALLEDAAPALVLADDDVARMATSEDALASLPALARVGILDIAEGLGANPEDYLPVEIRPSDVAFLQYTSGSTGRPKGVMVTHDNIMANMAMIQQGMQFCAEDTMVSWLPMFHDMGLIGCLLQPLYIQCRTVLMPSSAFLMRPSVWWEAVSKYRGTVTGAPNFAYALSARRVPPEVLTNLDLSSLRVTFNGAEPVRADTMAAFARTFAPAQFNPATFFPCYGLAEATLFASGGPCGSGVRGVAVDREAFGKGRAVPLSAGSPGVSQTLVSCGRPARGLDVHIVEPETGRVCAPGEVGEIALAGASISQGYWRKPEVNERTFPSGTLRTGDLGVLLDGELYVTGRIKDTIIIAGRNHYPQDIESTVEALEASVRPGCVVAYGTEGDSPQVGIVAEVQRQDGDEDYARMARAIAGAVGGEHGVPVARVTLIPTRRLSKTSSGKLQRSLTRKQVESGALEVLFDWAPAQHRGDAEPASMEAPIDRAAQRWAKEKDKVEALLAHLRWYGEHRLNSALMDERRCFPPHVILDLGNLGLMGIHIPPKFGGYGFGAQSFLALAEQICALDLSLGLFWGLNNTLGIFPLLRAGTPEQQAHFLPALARGRILGSFALTEPGAGSNPMAMESLAVEQAPGQLRLNGEKTWTGAGAWCGVLTTFVREQGADGAPRGISAFVVEQGRPGFRVGPEQMTVGIRATVQNRIYFDDLPLEAGDRLGKPGEGMAIAAEAMNLARFGLGVMALGGAKRAMQLGLRYAARGTVATGRLLDHPMVRGDFTEAALGLEALEGLLQRCARELDAAGGLPAVDRVPEAWLIVAKVFGSELCGEIVDRVLQVMGGRGYIESNAVAQIWRDARILRIFEGPSETLTYHLGNLIARGHLEVCLAMHTAPESASVATRLRTDLEALEARCDDPHLFRSLAGDLGLWTVLEMVLADSGSRREVLDWASRSYRRALRAAEERIAVPSLSGDQLEAIAAAYGEAIGDMEPSLPGEEWERDPLLRRETPTVYPRGNVAFAGAMDPVDVPRPTVKTPEPRNGTPTSGNGGGPRTTAATPAPPKRVPPRRPAGNNGGATPAASAPPVTMPAPQPNRTPVTPAAGQADAGDIVQTLIGWYARSANIAPERITPEAPLTELGLDSLTATELSVNIEERYNVILKPAVLWECPNLQAIAEYVQKNRGDSIS